MRAFACLMAIMFLAAPAGAAPVAAPAAAATDWVPGMGEADMKGAITDDRARLDAKAKARANAVEKAMGQSVAYKFMNLTTKRDKTKSSFVYRELLAQAQGVVVDHRNEKFAMSPVYGQNKEVLYMRYVCTGEYRVAPPPAPDPGFHVDLRLSSDSYYAGDALTFDVEVSKPAHLMVFNLAADDRVYVVYPNDFVQALEAAPRKPLRLPAPTDKFELKPVPLEGHAVDEESLRVIATRHPVRPPRPDKGKGSLSVVDFMRWLYQLPPGGWSEDEKTYTVVKRGSSR